MKPKIALALGIYLTLLLGFSLFFLITKKPLSYVREIEQENKALKEAQITEYNNGYRDGILETMDDYIELTIEYDEAKELIKSLKKQPYYIDNIMSDLDDLMEWTIRYYEVEPQTIRDVMELTEYILWKDSKLYERILNEWQ